MKAVALTPFHDAKKNVNYKAGDEFTVTKARFEEMNLKAAEQGFGTIVAEIKDEPLSPAGRNAAKREKARGKSAKGAESVEEAQD